MEFAVIAAAFAMASLPAPPEMPSASAMAPDVEPAPEEPKATSASDVLARAAVAVRDRPPSLRMKSEPSPPEIPVDRAVPASRPPVFPVPPKLKEELSRITEAVEFAVIAAAFAMASSPAPPVIPWASATAPASTAPLEVPKTMTESAETELIELARTFRSPSLQILSFPSPPSIPVDRVVASMDDCAFATPDSPKVKLLAVILAIQGSRPGAGPTRISPLFTIVSSPLPPSIPEAVVSEAIAAFASAHPAPTLTVTESASTRDIAAARRPPSFTILSLPSPPPIPRAAVVDTTEASPKDAPAERAAPTCTDTDETSASVVAVAVTGPLLAIRSCPPPPSMPAESALTTAEESEKDAPPPAPRATSTETLVAFPVAVAPETISPELTMPSQPSPPSIPRDWARESTEASENAAPPARPMEPDAVTAMLFASTSAVDTAVILAELMMASLPAPPAMPAACARAAAEESDMASPPAAP